MKFTKFALIILVTLSLGIMETKAEDKPVFKSTLDSISYIMGMQLSQFLGNDYINLNYDLLKKGVNDLAKGQKAIDENAIQQIITNYQETKMKEVSQANIDKGKKFLTENKTKPGVKTTPSGLQYQVITEGKGEKPKATDNVKVHYTGTLIDGTVFDSSVDRGEPVEFPLNRVIAGWTEGVQLMAVGSKYKFFIPAELGYGDRGAGGVIGPNECLVFEVELLGIMPPTPTEQEAPQAK